MKTTLKMDSGQRNQVKNFAAQLLVHTPLVSTWCCRRYLDRALVDELRKTRADEPFFSVNSSLALKALDGKPHFWLNLQKIHRYLPPYLKADGKTARLYDYFLAAGSLKPHCKNIRDNVIYREMSDLLEYGDDFRRMPLYVEFQKHLANGQPVVRHRVLLDSPSKIDDYFMMYLDLADSIKRRGLRSREKLIKDEGVLQRWRAPKGLRTNKTEWFERDLGLAVLEDGTVVFNSIGQHRRYLAIALGVSSIPVEVQMIHKDWLADVWKGSGLTPLEALEDALGRLRERFEADVSPLVADR